METCDFLDLAYSWEGFKGGLNLALISSHLSHLISLSLSHRFILSFPYPRRIRDSRFHLVRVHGNTHF